MQTNPAMTVSMISIAILVVILVALVLILAAGIGVAIYLSYCDRVFKRLFARPKPLPQTDRSPKQIDRSTINGRGRNWFYTYRREWLNIRTTSFDGAKLSAYYRPSSDPTCRNMVIFLHGYDEHPSEVAAYARLMMKKIQCHVLITHLRAHGMSSGKSFTWGLKESVDLDSWFEFTRRRLGNGCRIYLVGRGIGATTALLAAQQEGFCPDVCGIIADSPLDTLNSFMKNTLSKGSHANPDSIIWRVRGMARKKFGFDINMCDCAIHAGRIKVPVLFFEGGEDEITPPSGVRDIYDNLRCQKRMVVVNNAKHLMSYEKAQAMYEREVQKFIESCLVRLVKLRRL